MELISRRSAFTTSEVVLPLFPVCSRSDLNTGFNAPFIEDPIILSGTLRSTLDVFDEYQDAEIVRQTSCLFLCY